MQRLPQGASAWLHWLAALAGCTACTGCLPALAACTGCLYWLPAPAGSPGEAKIATVFRYNHHAKQLTTTSSLLLHFGVSALWVDNEILYKFVDGH